MNQTKPESRSFNKIYSQSTTLIVKSIGSLAAVTEKHGKTNMWFAKSFSKYT